MVNWQLRPQGDYEQGGREAANSGDPSDDKGRLEMDYCMIEHMKWDGLIGGFGSNTASSLEYEN